MVLFAVLSLAFQVITVEQNGIKFLYAKEWLDSLVPLDYDTAQVTKNVDGDTIKVLVDGKEETIRMIGVDTPETVHPSQPVEYFGKAASLFTKKLVHVGETVRLTYDWDPRDKYGRLLAYVWFEATYEGKKYWILHNVVLILNGFGHAYTVFAFRDDYMTLFKEAERYARDNRIGLWGNVDEEKVIEALETRTYEPQEAVAKTPQTTVSVKIVEIQPYGSDEYVLIKNTGSTSINLAGWKLFSQGGQWFTFPSITLHPGETLSIHTGTQAGSSSPASKKLIWSNKYIWNNKGDKAILYDAQGNVVDVYEY
jgi:micrococcal nuclease